MESALKIENLYYQQANMNIKRIYIPLLAYLDQDINESL